MKRRRFFKSAIAGGTLLSAGSIAWLSIGEYAEPLEIEYALEKLDRLVEDSPKMSGSWNLYQVLSHCAQSVEYSMTGFPEHKAELFKTTVGKLAFSAFSSKGKMTHGLDEIIPGAPAFSKEENIDMAYERFKKSLLDFQKYEGALQQHFAYGELTREQYEKAHVMHFNNHLLEAESDLLYS